MYNLICLPQDIWRDRVLPFVPELRSIVRLDSAVNNKLCRTTFHNNISGMRHNWQVESIKSALKWFDKRNIAVHSIVFKKEEPKRTFTSSLLSMLRKITGRNALHHSRSFERIIRSHNIALTCLDISACDIGDVRGLRYALNLTHLSVCSCRNSTSDSFVPAVRECTQLRTCTITFCNQLQEAATAAVLIHCKELVELIISQPENLDTVFSQITQPLKLRKLEWYNSLAHISSQFIRTIATQMPQMRHLEWMSLLPNESENASSEEDFHLLVRNCRKLEIFRILGSTPMTNQSLMCMGQSLIMLRQLKLGRSELITDAGVQALAEGCRCLEYLDVSGNGALTNIAIQDVGLFCRLLVCLSVQGCARLTDHAFLTLNVETLQDLDISGTFVSGTFTSHILQASARIHNLRCRSCPNLHSNILRRLPHNNRLYMLTLERLRLTHEGWMQLSLLLPNLHHLSLTACDTFDETVLRSFIIHCNVLHALFVSRCSISKQSGTELKLFWEARIGSSRHVLLHVH